MICSQCPGFTDVCRRATFVSAASHVCFFTSFLIILDNRIYIRKPHPKLRFLKCNFIFYSFGYGFSECQYYFCIVMSIFLRQGTGIFLDVQCDKFPLFYASVLCQKKLAFQSHNFIISFSTGSKNWI